MFGITYTPCKAPPDGAAGGSGLHDMNRHNKQKNIKPGVFLLLAAGILCHVSIQAAEPGIREDSPKRYEVQEGDTLWGIAERFLEEPWLWPQLWDANPQIENPHLIYPGDVIGLNFVDGEPVFTLERAGEEGREVAESPDLPTVRLSPRIRREPFVSPIPSIPLEAINAFLEENRMVGAAALEVAPAVVGTERGTLLAATGDVIYANGQWDETNVSTYEIIRPGSVFADPETEEIIGQKAEVVAEATIVSREGNRAVLRVGSTRGEVRMGDRLARRPETRIEAEYFPRPPSFQVEARIVEIGKGLAYGGVNDSLILNVGERDDIEPGHLLTIQKPDRAIPDPESRDTLIFPGEKYATVLIYQVFERSSLALVLSSSGPIRMADRAVTP